MSRRPGPVEAALRTAPLLFVVLLPVVLLGFGQRPAAGFALGALASVGSLWLARWVVRNFVQSGVGKVPAISMLQVAFLIKLPLFALVIFFTNSLGMGAVLGFFGGYLLVYFALVLGAVLRRNAPDSTLDE